jgi:hypothetical protein
MEELMELVREFLDQMELLALIQQQVEVSTIQC